MVPKTPGERIAPTAADFGAALTQLTGAPDEVPAMREVFGLAKSMIEMPLDEVRLLLASNDHLHRVGAVTSMTSSPLQTCLPRTPRRSCKPQWAASSVRRENATPFDSVPTSIGTSPGCRPPSCGT